MYSFELICVKEFNFDLVRKNIGLGTFKSTTSKKNPCAYSGSKTFWKSYPVEEK